MTSTRKVEMVETHNIALALDRLRNAGAHDCDRWKRALYHALGMSGGTNTEQLEAIRNALGLP